MSRIHKHTEMCWNFGEKKEKKDKNFLIFLKKLLTRILDLWYYTHANLKRGC